MSFRTLIKTPRKIAYRKTPRPEAVDEDKENKGINELNVKQELSTGKALSPLPCPNFKKLHEAEERRKQKWKQSHQAEVTVPVGFQLSSAKKQHKPSLDFSAVGVDELSASYIAGVSIDSSDESFVAHLLVEQGQKLFPSTPRRGQKETSVEELKSLARSARKIKEEQYKRGTIHAGAVRVKTKTPGKNRIASPVEDSPVKILVTPRKPVAVWEDDQSNFYDPQYRKQLSQSISKALRTPSTASKLTRPQSSKSVSKIRTPAKRERLDPARLLARELSQKLNSHNESNMSFSSILGKDISDL